MATVATQDRRLDDYPELVRILFPKEFQLPEVRERLARASFPYQWVSQNAILAPQGSSKAFAELDWSLTRPDEKLLRPKTSA